MNSFLWFLILLNAYFLLLYFLVKSGWLKRLNMSLFGPALMIKTQRGRGLLDFFARARRLFDGAASLGIYLTAVVMFLMSLLLILQLYAIFQLTPEQAPSPRLILGIPGINPIIPVGYGIAALVFAVVVHEFSHGILARVHNLTVKTMGILVFVIPIGAFVEPDEVELKAAPRKVRTKVFAAGPISNMFFAILFAFVFSGALMSQAEPVPAVPVEGVELGGPADRAGVVPGLIITHVNGVHVTSRDEFAREIDRVRPGDNITLQAYGGGFYTVQTTSCSQLYADRPEYCRDPPPGGLGLSDPDNKTMIGIRIYPTAIFQKALSNPFGNWTWTLYYVALPFEALQGQFPLAGYYNDFYVAPFHAPTFWFLANLAYWLFWINLMLGLTNALPILPLDGGYIFRDWVGAYLQWRHPHVEEGKRDAIVRRVSLFVAFTLLFLVILQFVGPHVRGLFT